MRSHSALSSFLVLLMEVSADPFFVIQHGNAVVTSRRDPIISPGGISGHVHSIVGTSSFKPSYDYDNSVNGKCTTADVSVDKSSYWAPQLYRKQDDESVQLVKMNRVNTQGTEQMYEFPKGMKMLAGNPFRNTFDANDPAQAAIGFTCLGAEGPVTNGFPDRSCPQDLRAEVTFLRAGTARMYGWKGANTIMTLFYEFHFVDTYDYKAGARVLAQGDDTGYGFHGDFTNGWPVGLFSEIFTKGKECEVLFEVENCSPLKPYFTGDRGATCQPDDASVIVNEEIGDTAPIAKLPGDNPIWNGGPAPNKGGSAVAATSSAGAGAGVSQPASAVSAATSLQVTSQISSQNPNNSAQSFPASSATSPLALPATTSIASSTTTSRKGWGNWGKRRRSRGTY
ncbi:uncharacterized protein IL334_005805 [Kwoniella shivajii]|uniref:DUF1996 domain-containing protein n=1 Tax=Kwoniella shivajii TaxID=564305 RepID=A0ABZ1D616_9TREE|nr:hypothetical protein IL334_005805 [Kwoniella shivajii]